MNSAGTNSQKFPKYKIIPEIKQYLDTYKIIATKSLLIKFLMDK